MFWMENYCKAILPGKNVLDGELLYKIPMRNDDDASVVERGFMAMV
jgi:hypothetical protein